MGAGVVASAPSAPAGSQPEPCSESRLVARRRGSVPRSEATSWASGCPLPST